uniref:Actin-like protein 7, putative n=3 Tax=Toxoplasma gondii TaxID=5811 RepID=A0A0F7URA4_TOXGV|nr:TPA: actin-like protein 7, putative [Toxoplasma gondii VEG]
MIVDKDATEDLWEVALRKLTPSETDDMVCLLTCPPLASSAIKEWIFEVFFERFRCKRMALLQPGPLSLFSSGRSRGLVVEIGHSITSAVPVFEGFPLAYATFRSFRAGGAVTSSLSQLLAETSWFNTYMHLHSPAVTEEIKHKLCLVAIPDERSHLLREDTSEFEDRAFQLPDGTVIEVRFLKVLPLMERPLDYDTHILLLMALQLDQRLRCRPAELLFDDSLHVEASLNEDNVPPCLQSELRASDTLQSLVHAAIAATDPEFQEEMQQNIVLAGGSSLLGNLSQRLHGELLCIEQIDRDPFCIATDSHRRFSAWVGGSMLASLGTFEKFCIQRHAYEEGNRTLSNMIHEKNMGR